MVADIDWNDCSILNQHLKGELVAEVDLNRLQPLQSAAQGMHAQGWMKRVCFQQLQGLQVLLAPVRTTFHPPYGRLFYDSLLLVAHTRREADGGLEHNRIISAHRATKLERKVYE